MPDHVNQYERAFRAWPVLVATARKRSTVTYAELSDHLQVHPRPIRFVLGVIQDWCLTDKKPPLTILVVNQHNRQPGQGFIAWDTNNLEEGYEQVYAFPWWELSNPFAFADEGTTLEELAYRLVRSPADATRVYGLIQNRGFAQKVFRLALLTAYGGRCGFCGLSLVDALQAAHIIPWSKASPAERVLPSNGLLLCATHHALFDADILTVAIDRTIICREQQVPRHRWNQVDREAAAALNGRALISPADERHCPSAGALAFRTERLEM